MYVVKKRCKRCLEILRDNGTCPNPNCVRYEPEEMPSEDNSTNITETPSTGDSTPSTGGNE